MEFVMIICSARFDVDRRLKYVFDIRVHVECKIGAVKVVGT